MTQPLISVVMPVFDGARYVAEAIDDVLGQTYARLELIVIDDGSTDETAEIVRQRVPPVQLLSREHAGVGAARNHGARAARGDYLAFCDADDRFPADRLERQVAVLESDPTLDAAFGEVEEFVSPELDPDVTRSLREPNARRSARLVMSLLLRAASFRRVGDFAADLGRGVDLDWLARADDAGLRFEPSEGVAVRRRLHDASTGMRRRGDEDDYVRALRTAIARRRAT